MNRIIREATRTDMPMIMQVLESAKKIMQHNIMKYGFRYCGIIHLASGDERLAYQKLRAH